MSKKLDAAIDALVDALAGLPEHELEGWQYLVNSTKGRREIGPTALRGGECVRQHPFF